MKRRWLLALVAVNLLVLLALAFIYPHLMVSPGALVGAHAELATDCFACHAPLRGASTERCMACHAPADIGVRTTKGVAIARSVTQVAFHQELLEQDCLACHSDHQGAKLTQRSRKPFSHDLLRPATRDRCEACHQRPTGSLHRQITSNCAQCHRVQGWKPATFDHADKFVLDGDHDAACTVCHTSSDYSRYTCYGCHEHTPANVRAEHEEEGIRDFQNCVKCHRSADGEPGEGGSLEGNRKGERD